MYHTQLKPVPVMHHSISAYTETRSCFYKSSHPLLSPRYKLEIGPERLKETMTLTYSTLYVTYCVFFIICLKALIHSKCSKDVQKEVPLSDDQDVITVLHHKMGLKKMLPNTSFLFGLVP